MKRIEVKLSIPVVAPLLDVIRAMAESLKGSLASTVDVESIDEDLRGAWIDDLLAAQNRDLDVLLALFDEDFFREGAILLDEENAEVITRACAAVRLRLRSSQLSGIDDRVMEQGNPALDDLPESSRKALMCYVFLATMQELIIQHLELGDPD